MKKLKQNINLPQAIFFDWDGTLVDSFSVILMTHNHTLRHFGFQEIDREEFMPFFGKPREQIFEGLYKHFAKEARDVYGQFYMQNHTELLKPMDGAHDLLEAINKFGIKQGVVSNKMPGFLNAEIRSLGWEHYFISTVGAGEAREDKPSSAPLSLALEKAAFEFYGSDLWFVGDTDADFFCAHNYGCLSVLINDSPAILEKYNISADYSFNNCYEIHELLLQISQK